jgi:hypothetical protein
MESTFSIQPQKQIFSKPNQDKRRSESTGSENGRELMNL